MKEGQKVVGDTFVSDYEAFIVVQPGEEPLDFPPSLIAAKMSSVLSHHASVCAIGRDERNSLFGETLVERVAVVRLVSDKKSWAVWNECLTKKRFHKRRFVGGS